MSAYNVYVVTHLHEYGASTHLVLSDTYPTEKQVVRELELEFEPSKSESIQICSLSDEEYKNPKMLTRRDGDDEEFDEFA
jgi:hypothetical protein